jgi:dolichyl-diphosphooligosaccharide--protein glycosyltransferase
MKRGVMRSDEGTAPLSGMILIMENGERKRYSWPNMTGLYVIANRATGQLFVMQEELFDSMLVQMLLGDPTRFSGEFELVVDRAPWARAYRVK